MGRLGHSESYDRNECQQCHIVLEMDDIVEGRTLCRECEQMGHRIDYLLSAQSEEEADRRFEEVFGKVEKND
jgi:hypothetical protein